MRRKHQRLIVLLAGGVLLVAAAGLTLVGLRGQIVYFVTPTELAQSAHHPGQRLRLGGLVAPGSLRREADGANHFNVTDGERSVEVRYQGLLPDLFREGQGVVAEGAWQGSMLFLAERVLAKHDENYMPTEVAEALKRRGDWRGGEQPSAD